MAKLKKVEEEEPASVPFLVYLKAFFLISAIIVGMFFLSRAAEKAKLEKKQENGISLPHSLDLSKAKEGIQDQIDHEIRTNEVYKKTVDTIEDKRDEVLGEATKAADVLVEKSKQTFFDYMYEHTVGAVIEKMIEQMPKEQKEKLIERVQ